MAMNGARFRAIWNNMTPILQKVYGGVPDDNCMTHSAIHAGLARKGLARDLHSTQGCLNTLLKMGVIAEPERGCFTPVAGDWDDTEDTQLEIETMPDTAIAAAFVAAKDEATSSGIPALIVQQPAAVPPTDPIDRLTKITASLRGLADEIEATALDFTEQLALIEAKTAKLEQLRALLKGALE